MKFSSQESDVVLNRTMCVFDDTFKVSSAALYLNLGHPSLPLTLKWVLKMIILYALYFPTFVILIYSSIYHDNFTKICTNLSLALVLIVISIDYGILIVHKKTFNDMIKMTEEDLEHAITLETVDKLVVKRYTAKGSWSSKFWLIMVIVCDGMFYSKAILGTPYTALVGNLTLIPIHELSYPTYIEEMKNEIPVYAVILGFQIFYTFFTCLMYIGFYPLAPIFIMHACGQIELVIRKVEILFLEKDIEGEETIKKIQNIVRHTQRIYSFVDNIQQTHKILFEMFMKTSMLINAILCFGVIESYNKGSISLDLLGFIFSCVMQCFIPCYYCEVLLRKGEDLRVAIYGCGWERHWVPKTRSLILLMLTRTMHPLSIRAVFRIVCLEAFTDVNSQTYRIFNVVNAAWNRS